jgi:CDP-diacylglycerol pyrophosphatase
LIPSCKANKTTCSVVNLSVYAQYIITIPDMTGLHKYQTLLIPVETVSGIEAHEDTENKVFLPKDYFWNAAAWGIRHYTPHWVVVAINSANTRSQDQLHLHICDVDSTVLSTIKTFLGRYGSALSKNQDKWNVSWPTIQLQPGHNYYSTQLSGQAVNPFQIAFSPYPGGAAPSQRADVNLALVIDPANHYYLFYNTDGGAAEALLNSPCSYH